MPEHGRGATVLLGELGAAEVVRVARGQAGGVGSPSG